MAEASLSAEQVEALARALCADENWEHHDQTDDYPCSRCKRQARLIAPTVAAMLSAAEDAARAEGVQRGRTEITAAVEAVIGAHSFGAWRPEWKTERHNGAHDVVPVASVRAALADSTAPDAHAAHDAAGGDERG